MKPQAESTARTYRYCLDRLYRWSHVIDYTGWDNDALETEVLGFLGCFKRDGKSLATVLQHVSALSWLLGPERIRTAKVRDYLAQYAYDNGRPPKRAKAVGIDELIAMVQATPWQRDKTILTLGWAGALRASEIVSIRRSDLTEVADGFELQIRRSKTDQRGKGKIVALPLYHLSYAVICPTRNLKLYLLRQADLFEAHAADDLILPFTTRTISRVIEKAAILARLPEHYSSHSLRRGLATTAARHGIDDRIIMKHGRWLTREVFDQYVEEGTLWQKTALDFLR